MINDYLECVHAVRCGAGFAVACLVAIAGSENVEYCILLSAIGVGAVSVYGLVGCVCGPRRHETSFYAIDLNKS
jgi:hypothetical protein